MDRSKLPRRLRDPSRADTDSSVLRATLPSTIVASRWCGWSRVGDDFGSCVWYRRFSPPTSPPGGRQRSSCRARRIALYPCGPEPMRHDRRPSPRPSSPGPSRRPMIGRLSSPRSMIRRPPARTYSGLSEAEHRNSMVVSRRGITLSPALQGAQLGTESANFRPRCLSALTDIEKTILIAVERNSAHPAHTLKIAAWAIPNAR